MANPDLARWREAIGVVEYGRGNFDVLWIVGWLVADGSSAGTAESSNCVRGGSVVHQASLEHGKIGAPEDRPCNTR